MRNIFATKARKLHGLIVPKYDRLDYNHDPEKVLEILDKISIPEGKALRCYLVNVHCHDIGDNSFLYVNDIEEPEGVHKMAFIDETWKNITVEPTEMGMWQVYLLMTTIHVMPYWWHGGYNQRKNILSPSGLKSIRELNGKDLSHISESDLQPAVKFTQWTDRECMGMISNTYWTEWGGLIRETVFIDMKDNKITNYGPVFNEVLLKYDSLMCY